MNTPKTFQRYWLYAFTSAIVIGEIFGPAIAGHPIVLISSASAFIAMIAYYAVLSFFMADLYTKQPLGIALFATFIIGVLAEGFVFGNIHGPNDTAGIMFFGLFYMLIFGFPWFVT